MPPSISLSSLTFSDLSHSAVPPPTPPQPTPLSGSRTIQGAHPHDNRADGPVIVALPPTMAQSVFEIKSAVITSRARGRGGCLCPTHPACSEEGTRGQTSSQCGQVTLAWSLALGTSVSPSIKQADHIYGLGQWKAWEQWAGPMPFSPHEPLAPLKAPLVRPWAQRELPRAEAVDHRPYCRGHAILQVTCSMVP